MFGLKLLPTDRLCAAEALACALAVAYSRWLAAALISLLLSWHGFVDIDLIG